MDNLKVRVAAALADGQPVSPADFRKLVGVVEREAAERMRERCAQIVEKLDSRNPLALTIRTLEIEK